MMPKPLHAMIEGAPVALASELARDLLSIEMPAAMAPAGQSATASIERFTVHAGLAVLPVRGLLTPNSEMLERWMGWATYFGIAEAAAELAERADVSAVALLVNSPGGLVLSVDQAAGAIAALAKIKPVHAIASPMAASAAYWIAAQASSLAVSPGGIVGSIGVALQTSSTVGPTRDGEQNYTLTSTHARAKLPDPATEEGMTELKRSLDASEALFHAAVSAGRKIPLADLPQRLSVTDDPRDGGACFKGQDAISRGLADTVESQAAFLARLVKQYGRAPSGPRTGYRARAAAAAAQACL